MKLVIFVRREILVMILLLIMVISSPFGAATVKPAETALSNIKIGYGPKSLFDAAIGSPVFTPGETIWISLPFDSFVKLKHKLPPFPSEADVADTFFHKDVPAPLYRFKDSDLLGTWLLKIIGVESNFTIPVYLTTSKLSASISQLQFDIDDSSLKMDGKISLQDNLKHEGGIILLARIEEKKSRFNLVSDSTYNNSKIYVHFEIDSSRPEILVAKPYLANATEPIEALVWSEISYDIPLIRKVGNISVVTYVTGMALRTFKTPIVLQNTLNETVEIQLPRPNQLDESGEVPFKISRGVLRFYIQIRDLIYVLDEEYIFTPELAGRTVIERMKVNPLLDPVSFTFKDHLSNITRYLIVLVLNVNGVDRIWSTEIFPPLTRVDVVNQLTGERIMNYSLSFEDGVEESLNLNGLTYAILKTGDHISFPIRTRYGLTVEGIELVDKESRPDLLELEPLRSQTVAVNVGQVNFYVYDSLGNELPSGRLKVSRLDDSIPLAEESWMNRVGPHSITLPLGRFLFTVESEGFVESDKFELKSPNMRMNIRFKDLVISQPEEISDLPIFILVTSVLAIEMIVAVKVWSRALKSKSSKRD